MAGYAVPNYYYPATTNYYYPITTTSASTLTWNSFNHVIGEPVVPVRPRTALERLNLAVEATCAKGRKAIG